MSIKLKELIALLKSTEIPVYRDLAPTNKLVPYIVYSYISEDHKRASSNVYKRLPMYQISLFTKDTEVAYSPILKVLNNRKVSFSTIGSIQGDENDSKINHFYSTVRCVEDV